MPMDGPADICSCNICTPTIHGGRIPRGARLNGLRRQSNALGQEVHKQNNAEAVVEGAVIEDTHERRWLKAQKQGMQQ